jgi:hypothetical protein
MFTGHLEQPKTAETPKAVTLPATRRVVPPTCAKCTPRGAFVPDIQRDTARDLSELTDQLLKMRPSADNEASSLPTEGQYNRARDFLAMLSQQDSPDCSELPSLSMASAGDDSVDIELTWPSSRVSVLLEPTRTALKFWSRTEPSVSFPPFYLAAHSEKETRSLYLLLHYLAVSDSQGAAGLESTRVITPQPSPPQWPLSFSVKFECM